jgi:hypothetical protein
MSKTTLIAVLALAPAVAAQGPHRTETVRFADGASAKIPTFGVTR